MDQEGVRQLIMCCSADIESAVGKENYYETD